MSIQEFWDCTPRDLQNKLKGWFQEEKRKQDEAYRLQRWAVFLLLQPHVKKKSLNSPTDLGTLPEERKSILKLAPPDPEAVKRMQQKMDEYHKKNFQKSK